MVRILPTPYKKITDTLNERLRNKLTTISIGLDYLDKSKPFTSESVKRALADLDYIEKKLEKYELKNKLPSIREVFISLYQLKRPSKELIKKAASDFEYINNSLPPLSFPLNKNK